MALASVVSVAPAQTWELPGARCRVRLVRTAKSPWPADVGKVTLWPNGVGSTNLDARVFAGPATPVGHTILWTAPGEPLTVLFDCSSGSAAFDVYLDTRPMPAPPQWEPKAGVVLETRTFRPAATPEWTDPRTPWAKAGPVTGRSVVRAINDGLPPHGATPPFICRYTGYLDIPENATYSFATMSDDASSLMINGHLAAKWFGKHSIHGGRLGQYSGTVPLKRGQARIDAYNVQDDGGFQVAAAWKPPGQKYFAIIPADVFAPVADYSVKAYESAPGKPMHPRFTWYMKQHAKVDDMVLVDVTFAISAPLAAQSYRWTFDDGLAETGVDVLHTFLRTGLRTVTLEVLSGGKAVSKTEQRVNVRAAYGQQYEWPDAVFKAQRDRILRTDASRIAPDDIHALVDVAARIEDRELLTFAGATCLARSAEFGPAHAELFYKLGFHYQHPAIRRYPLAKQALTRARELAPEGTQLRELATVHLAGYLVHADEDTTAARDLLRAVDETVLPPHEARLRQIYQADALLAEGHVERARQLYQAAGTVVGRGDIHYSVRRRARLETAKDYLRRAEYDAAEQIIRHIEWETPLERLDTETGLVMIGVNIGRVEYPFAFAHCRRLLKAAATDRHRGELLLRFVEVGLAMDRKDHAAAAYRMLQDEHTYSEAAARAKDRWGVQFRAPGNGG